MSASEYSAARALRSEAAIVSKTSRYGQVP
jgi:hypothetical protein